MRRAVTIFGALAQLFISGSCTQFERGLRHYNHAEYDKAIVALTEAITHEPANRADAYYYRARAYQMKSEYNAAIADYTETITRDPAMRADAYYLRGNVYQARSEYDAAVADYTEAITHGLDNRPDVYYERGRAYHKKGEYDAAIADYSEVIKLDSQYAGDFTAAPYYYKAKALDHAARYIPAISVYQAFIAKTKTIIDRVKQWEKKVDKVSKVNSEYYSRRRSFPNRLGVAIEGYNRYRSPPGSLNHSLLEGHYFVQQFELMQEMASTQPLSYPQYPAGAHNMDGTEKALRDAEARVEQLRKGRRDDPRSMGILPPRSLAGPTVTHTEASMSSAQPDVVPAGTVISIVPSKTVIRPGESFTVDVFINTVSNLRAYQVNFLTTGGTSGRLERIRGAIDRDRKDYVFAGLEGFELVDQIGGRLLGVLQSGGVHVTTWKYLGRFTLRPSADASGSFEINIRTGPDASTLRDSHNLPMPFSVMKANVFVETPQSPRPAPK